MDDTCVDCDLCRNLAPEVFARDDSASLSYVHQQPANEVVLSRAEEARESCPTESIGHDGT